MKKLISLLLAVLMLASMSTVSFADGYNEETGEYVWTFDEFEEGILWAGGDPDIASGSNQYVETGDEDWPVPDMRIKWRKCAAYIEAVEIDDGNMALKLEMVERNSGGPFGIQAMADTASDPNLTYYEMDIMWEQCNSSDGAGIYINENNKELGKLWSVGNGWFEYTVKEWIAGSVRLGVWYHMTAQVDTTNYTADVHLTSDDGLTDVWQHDVPVGSNAGIFGIEWNKSTSEKNSEGELMEGVGHILYLDNIKIGYTPEVVEPEEAYGDISFDADGNNVTASLTATAAAEGQTAKFILAVTNKENNELVAIDIADVTAEGEVTTSVVVPDGDYEVQAFLLGDRLAPLANSGIIME